MQSKLTTCIKRLFYDVKQVRQTYDFFSNPKVTKAALIEPHLQNTVNRIDACDAEYILAIQDGTVLNYSAHKAKTEMGRISRIGKSNQYGLIQHSTLCVTNKNECLGLIDLQHYHFDDFDLTIHKDYRAIEDKKTRCWINSLKNMRKRLGKTNKRIITVTDREGDFFEFLHELVKEDESFVIRVQHDRCTGEKNYAGEKFSELLEKQNDIGEMQVEINDVKTHEIKQIKLRIKILKDITIPVPVWAGLESKGKDYQPIQVNVVMAYNEEYCWILVSNLPANNEEDCQKIVIIYKERWHVEDYHKILKTGYQIDELYLHSSRQAIENALTMAAISACRLYWMIYVGRVEETIKADRVFSEHEWKCLYVYFKEKPPTEVPRLSEVIIRIAKLGGYKPKKDAKPPGIKLMWLGFQGFSIAAEMYRNVLSTKT